MRCVSTSYRGAPPRRIVTPARCSRTATAAVVDPKLGTDPAQRPTGGIKLDSSVHIHDQYLIGEGSQATRLVSSPGHVFRNQPGMAIDKDGLPRFYAFVLFRTHVVVQLSELRQKRCGGGVHTRGATCLDVCW